MVRSSLLEKDNVTGTCTNNAGTNNGPCAWRDTATNPAPLINLSSDTNWQRYRYRVFETIIPLRNVIMGEIYEADSPHCRAVTEGAALAPPQAGITLIIALIALVALTMAGIALVRSVDTGNVIAGNFAFRQSSMQATDTGVEAAFTQLGDDRRRRPGHRDRESVFPGMQTLDTNGIPTTVNWPSFLVPPWGATANTP